MSFWKGVKLGFWTSYARSSEDYTGANAVERRMRAIEPISPFGERAGEFAATIVFGAAFPLFGCGLAICLFIGILLPGGWLLDRFLGNR